MAGCSQDCLFGDACKAGFQTLTSILILADVMTTARLLAQLLDRSYNGLNILFRSSCSCKHTRHLITLNFLSQILKESAFTNAIGLPNTVA